MEVEQTSLRGKTAVVTGAGQGIGLGIVKALASSGARVICLDREDVGFSELEKIAGSIVLQGDVTDTTLSAKIDRVLEKFDLQLDILVNNAGIASYGDVLIASETDIQKVFDVNVFAVARLSRWAVEKMIRAGGGAIVNNASIFGVVGAEHSFAYSASKAAVVGLTRQMATDFGPNGIRVNAVAPGLIETPEKVERIKADKWRRHILVDQAPLRRVGKPADVARAVRFLASEEASYISGQILEVDGGWAMGRFPREVIATPENDDTL